MNNVSYTYRLKLILAGVLIWEAIFWSLSGVVLFLIGYLDPSATGQQIGFKFPEQFLLLVFLLPILGVYLFNVYNLNRFADAAHPTVRKYILQPVSSFNSFLTFFFFRNAIVLLIFAMAQPDRKSTRLNSSHITIS